MKNSQKGSVAIWAILIIVVVLAVVGYLYFKHINSTNVTSLGSGLNQPLLSSNVPITSSFPSDTVKDYVFDSVMPSNLVAVKLSHNSLQVESPWGHEKSYNGGVLDTLGQYTFDNGIKLTVGVNKLSPQDELKEMNLSPASQAAYNSVFQFISSKIGQNFSGYDFEKFLYETNQQVVDQAVTPEDKTGYSEVLVVKNITSFGPTDSLFAYANKSGKGFIWLPPNVTIPSRIEFWSTNGWRYDFLVPPKQNLTKEQIDAVIQSIKSL